MHLFSGPDYIRLVTAHPVPPLPEIVHASSRAPPHGRYAPPVDEFVLDRVSMQEGERATLSSARGLAILIIVSGSVSVEQVRVARGNGTVTVQ